MVPSVNIEFSGRQVVVCAEPTLLRERVERRFVRMLTPHAPHSIASLVLGESGGEYRLSEGRRAYAVDAVLANVVERVAQEVAERFIEALPALLWIHAGAVARDGRAVILPASWGLGKSTLTSELARCGWDYLSDDLAPLDPRSDSVFAFPRTPTVRANPGRPLPRDRVPDLPKAEVSASGWTTPAQPMPLGAIVFPRFVAAGAARIERCAPAEAAVQLVRHCLNFSKHRGAAVAYAAALVARVDVFRLDYGAAADGIELISRAIGPAAASRGEPQ